MFSVQYLAGIFDGEGCLCIIKAGKSGLHARLSIGNTCLPLLQSIQADWGGIISPMVSRRLQNYRLDLYKHEDLLKFLKEIQPYLFVKKAQVDYFMAEFAP